MSVVQRYYTRISEILAEAFKIEAENMEKAAEILAAANEEGHSIFGFGCNHAGLITLELFYRTGGMVTVNPIRAPGMMLELSPPTMTSEMERIPGYGKIILNNEPCKAGDVLIIHSVSGRNAVTIDMAECAREHTEPCPLSSDIRATPPRCAFRSTSMWFMVFRRTRSF